MYRWAGVDGVASNSRGLYIDARKLEFIEHLLDQEFLQNEGNLYESEDPRNQAATILEDSFRDLQDAITSRILFQTAGRTLFAEAPVFNYAADTFSGSFELDADVIEDLMDGLGAGEKIPDALTHWMPEAWMVNVVALRGSCDARHPY